MAKYINVELKNFGYLTVLKEKTIKCNNNYICECVCKCGKNIIVYKKYLLSGETKSCGCLKNEICRNRYWKGKGEISGAFLSSIKRCAKLRNIEFNIDTNFLSELYERQNKKCAISGIDLIIYTKNSMEKYKNKTTASIDRIDSLKGYTKDNVWFVHKHINIMKLDYTIKELLFLIKKIYEYKEFNLIDNFIDLSQNINKNSSNWQGYEDIGKTEYNAIKNSALSRNLFFDLSIKYLWELYIQQNKRCYLSGLQIGFYGCKKRTASLDRLNSKLGYTIDNCKWVHKDVNMIKQEYDLDYFYYLVNAIYKYNNLDKLELTYGT